MKTRRLSQGMIEAYNSRYRIRLKQQPGMGFSLVIIYHLKENKFYRARTILRLQEGITINEIIALSELLENH